MIDQDATASAAARTSAAERRRNWLRFLIPSSVGLLFFLVPFVQDGRVTVGLAVVVDGVRGVLAPWLPHAVTGTVVLSALLTVAASLRRNAGGETTPLSRLVRVGLPMTVLRVLGAVMAIMVLAGRGPAWIVGPSTGGVILNDLMTIIFVIFVFAGILLPCLTDFGLMEMAGIFMSPVFRLLFRLPGRSAIDALASWLGAAPVGVLITIDQYESGYYTQRQAAVIATNFSVVSVAFAYVIVDFVRLGEHFAPYYATVVAGGLVAAVILPRLPPLSRKRDVYRDDREDTPPTDEGGSLLARAVNGALARARLGPSLPTLLRMGLFRVLDIWFGLLPLVMVIGTLAIALTETTPIFRWLALPLVPLLELMRLPEAAEAAPAILVGFADQFLPAILAQSIESPVTRFVLACTSVNQLIYMSEVGVLLLRSPLPLGIGDLVAIFLLRTLITLPIATGVAHLLF